MNSRPTVTSLKGRTQTRSSPLHLCVHSCWAIEVHVDACFESTFVSTVCKQRWLHCILYRVCACVCDHVVHIEVDIIQSVHFCVVYVPIHNRLPESVLQDITLERYSPAPLTQKAAWVTSISITAPFCRNVKQMTCQIVVIRLLERDWFFNGVIYETIQTAEPHVQEAAST